MMKKLFLLLSILLFAKIIIAQTLIASYPFNGNANDVVGSANGTVNGASLTTDRFGNANSAYSFNGIADYIGGIASSFPNTIRTISLWFNADAGSIASNTPCPFSYGGGTCGTSLLMLLNNVSNGKYQTQGHCASNLNENTYFTVPEANWYNWVVTINGNSIKMYINGVLVNTTSTFSATTDVAGKDFYIGTLINNNGIGRFNPSGGYYFKGKIDDVKIYDGALTDAQVFDTYVNDVKKPGSGNGLQLTRTGALNTDPKVNIGSGYDFRTQPFTYESWVKRDDLHTTLNNNGIAFIVAEVTNGWGVGIDNTNTLFFTKVGVNAVFATGTIADTKWHHIAVVYTGTQIQFYIDGVAAGTSPYVEDFFNSGGNYTIGARQTGGNSNGDQTINGMIDETRIWRNIALTQTQIRDWMCKKVTSAHPAYHSLFAYFRFDDNSGPVISGYGSKFGMFNNSPLLQTSGAAIGDASAHDYINAIKTTNISHPSGENFAVTSTSGLPAGIHLYRVDEQPNTLTGTSGVGVNGKYFGVFQSGGTLPQYTAVYNYNGNPSVTPAIENQLRLNKRNDNATASWTLLPDVANEPANTITVTGQSTEYILGRVGGVLPITSFTFNAVKKDKAVLLSWNYNNNDNVASYEIERSVGNTSFSKMASLNAKENNIAYEHTDNDPATGINYYRIKIITKAGGIVYSKIVKIDFATQSTITISPNPANNFITINTQNNFNYVYIIDVNGSVVKQFTKSANNKYAIVNLSKGLYLVRLINGKEIVASLKIVIE